ncbi:substrate-binding domain-containing protein [Actinomadura sp. SCN-SB]|uniref:substrate-binding domain-containing protein n=1 Tax=Actinomadura sp. SCN-SB TaxID=3373092 RepID=UPI003753C4F5
MSGPLPPGGSGGRDPRDPAKYFGGGTPDDTGEHEAPHRPETRPARIARPRRGIMVGPLAGAVALVVLLGVSLYAFVVADGACAGAGTITLDVAVAPGIEPAMKNAADRLATSGQARCTRATVRTADPAEVAALLAGTVPGRAERRPDVWIPDSSLWVAMAGTKDRNVLPTRTSVARSPVVVALPRSLATTLRSRGNPSWNDLLRAAGATTGGAAPGNAVIPPGAARLLVPDPARNAAGMHALVLTDALLAGDPNQNAIFAGVARTVRESTVPTVRAEFARFRPMRTGRRPIALASERDVWAFNRTRPAEPAVAVHPREGTLSLDHPYTITAIDPARRNAARLLERAMGARATRDELRALGYRAPDGTAPATFTAASGVNPARTRELPAPRPARVRHVMQSWSRLALGIRLLTLLDISGTMAEPIAPGTTRLQATARTAQTGLSMMSDDTELGVWAFSTRLRGNRDWIQLVPVGPLGERIGSATRRQKVLSSLGAIRPKVTGDTGLFETLTAAYREMTLSYKPEFINTVLLFTDGKGNDDPGGPTPARTLSRLRAITDPGRPVQIIMVGVGRGVDTRELRRIAGVVPGAVYVAESPDRIIEIFLAALSRRIGG